MIIPNRRYPLEVADIFRQYGGAYRASHPLSGEQFRVMAAIETCRTAVLGGHWERCDHCGALRKAYDSCRNRHCPKCQWLEKEKWILKRKEELLPVSYFHIIFTLPDSLNPLVLNNHKVMYGLLFKAAAETLLDLGKDPKHLGAAIGLIAILHTWGQNLSNHPHLHCLVPCGGLSEDEIEWAEPKKSKKRKKFFVHVNIISNLFKKKFLHYLNKAYEKGELELKGRVAHLKEPAGFKKFKNQLYAKTWVTYCKKAFGGPEEVIEYLGRYIHRVAISNDRLLKVENGRVYFKWKNYKKGGGYEETSLEIFEFIRRFLLHVLPKGFFKIRYYGILASKNRQTKLRICQEILDVVRPDVWQQPTEPKNWQEWYIKLTGINPMLCPLCKKGRMIRTLRVYPLYCGSP
jgi:hypothetical protein